MTIIPGLMSAYLRNGFSMTDLQNKITKILTLKKNIYKISLAEPTVWKLQIQNIDDKLGNSFLRIWK